MNGGGNLAAMAMLAAFCIALLLMIAAGPSPERQRRRLERQAERERAAKIRQAAALYRALNEHIGKRKSDGDDGGNPG